MTSNYVAHLRSKSRLDDTLDVFPCHGVGGMVGMIMTGIFASRGVNSAVAEGSEGLAFGDTTLFITHMEAWSSCRRSPSVCRTCC